MNCAAFTVSALYNDRLNDGDKAAAAAAVAVAGSPHAIFVSSVSK